MRLSDETEDDYIKRTHTRGYWMLNPIIGWIMAGPIFIVIWPVFIPSFLKRIYHLFLIARQDTVRIERIRQNDAGDMKPAFILEELFYYVLFSGLGLALYTIPIWSE